MGKKQDGIARPDRDAGEACTSTPSPHVNDNLPSTRSLSSRGFSSSSNPYRPSPSFEASPAPVADFSAVQHRGGSTHEANVPPNPPRSDPYSRAYHEGYVNGYYQAIFSGATVAQVSSPFVPVASAIAPIPPFGTGLQPYASPTYFHPTTYAGPNPSHQVIPATDTGPVIHSQAPGWGSGRIPRSFGRNRNPPALPTFQLGPLGIASTSPPQAPVFPPSHTHPVVIAPQPISGPPPSSHGDESHECTWADCGKSFRRRYLLEDHVLYTHYSIKRHTCPAEGCGNKYAARAGLMKHVKKKHSGLLGTTVLPVDDAD